GQEPLIGSVRPGGVSPFQRASQIRVAQSTWCKLPAIVPKYASTGLASSSAIIPSIADRILSFAHWLYATSFRSWLLSAMAVLILAVPLWHQSLGRHSPRSGVTERLGRLEVDPHCDNTRKLCPGAPPHMSCTKELPAGFLVGTGGTACRPSTETGPAVPPRRQKPRGRGDVICPSDLGTPPP